MSSTSITFKDRWFGLLRSTRARFETPQARWTLFGAVLFLVVSFAAKAYLSDLAVSVGDKLGGWIADAAKQPTGLFLFYVSIGVSLFLCGWFAVLTLAAFRETRPEPVPQERVSALPQPLSGDERHAIQAVRIFWKKTGRPATYHVTNALLYGHTALINDGVPLADLLNIINEEVKKASAAFGVAVEDGAEVPKKVVMKCLIDLVMAHDHARRYLVPCYKVYPEVLLGDLRYKDKSEAWEASDREFLAALRELALRDDFGRLIDYLPDQPGT